MNTYQEDCTIYIEDSTMRNLGLVMIAMIMNSVTCFLWMKLTIQVHVRSLHHLSVGYDSFYIPGKSDISYTYTLLFLDHPVGTISFGSNDSENEGVTEQVSCLVCG